MYSEPNEVEKVQSKGRITIQNFDELLSQVTFDSPGKKPYTLEGESPELASFRINLEDHPHSPNSFSQDPSILMGPIPISPIICITQNFTVEATSQTKSNLKVNTIHIPFYEDDEDLEESISLLSPGFEKIKLHQYTPTFQTKDDDKNMSWEYIKVNNVEPAKKSLVSGDLNPFVSINIPDFQDLPGVSKASMHSEDILKSPEALEFPGSIDTDNGDFPEIRILPESPKVKNRHRSIDEGKNNLKEPVKKENVKDPKICGKTTSHYEENKANELRRPTGPKTKLVITSSNPNLKSINHPQNEGRTSVNISIVRHKPISLKKKTLPPPILKNADDIDSIEVRKTLTEPVLNTSLVVKNNKARAKSKLPEIRKYDPRKKHKSEPKINPYSSEWSQQTLKTHFNVIMKSSNQLANATTKLKKLGKKKYIEK